MVAVDTLHAVELGPSETVCRWESEARYYIAYVSRDLFGDWSVWVAWGGRGSRRGGHRLYAVSDREAAAALLKRLARLRLSRGYQLVETRRY